MKNLKNILPVVIAVFLNACATNHPLQFVDTKNGQVLKGQYNEANQSVIVFMPDGEVLSGHYTVNRASSVSFGSATGYSTTNSNMGVFNTVGGASLMSNTVANNGQAYAILKGNEGTVMEIFVNFSGSSGYGRAVTNKGEQYGVQF